VHHSTVTRVLAQAGLPRTDTLQRPRKIDPYLPLILETLQKYPKLRASRLFVMVCERGYKGSPDHFRHLIACVRPRPPAEAFLRLHTLKGEASQVDWAHFGHLTIGRAHRPLMAFVMVLSYSRQIFLRFFLDARMENFLRGHAAAFSAWNGLSRVLLYDNLRSAVLAPLRRCIEAKSGPSPTPVSAADRRREFLVCPRCAQELSTRAQVPK
jgi:transposase